MPTKHARNLYTNFEKFYEIGKTIGKIWEQKFYVKIIMGYTLCDNIPYKRIFSSNSLTLITIQKTKMKVFSWSWRSIDDLE